MGLKRSVCGAFPKPSSGNRAPRSNLHSTIRRTCSQHFKKRVFCSFVIVERNWSHDRVELLCVFLIVPLFYSWLDLNIIKAFSLRHLGFVYSHSSQTASYITGKDLFFIMRNYIYDIFDPNWGHVSHGTHMWRRRWWDSMSGQDL